MNSSPKYYCKNSSFAPEKIALGDSFYIGPRPIYRNPLKTSDRFGAVQVFKYFKVIK